MVWCIRYYQAGSTVFRSGIGPRIAVNEHIPNLQKEVVEK